MPVYELRCADGHRFEVLQAFSAPLPACACGAGTTKVPARFGVTGGVDVPPPAPRMPQTWRGTHGGDREYLTQLRRTAEARQRLEDRNPELRGDERPIVAHEGRFEGAPLRAGDPLPSAGAGESGHGHDHGGHGHSHGPGGHSHGHGPASGDGGTDDGGSPASGDGATPTSGSGGPASGGGGAGDGA